MKLMIGLMMLFSLKAYAQNGNAINGKWLKANKEDLIIEVFEEKGRYKGKINWSKDKSIPVGFIMLNKLIYNQKENRWVDGEIRDPKSGRRYDASITMKADGTIEVTGKFMFFKSTRTFRKIE